MADSLKILSTIHIWLSTITTLQHCPRLTCALSFAFNLDGT